MIWKRIGKLPEDALPTFVADALRLTGVPTLAVVGVTLPAVRSGPTTGALTVTAVQGPQLLLKLASEVIPTQLVL